MSAAYEVMRALRARSGLSMRAFAARLGAPLGTRYAYYEEKRFAGPLPIEAARQIAAALEPFGVDPREVLALAGLSAPEAQVTPIDTGPPVQFVHLAVALPNADALTRMFETMLETELSPARRDALARNLALRLPAALQRTAGSPPVPVRDAAPVRGAVAPPSARRRRPPRPESRT